MRVKIDYENGASIGTEESGYLNPLSQSQSGPIVVFIPPIRGGMAGYTILIKAIKDRARLFGCLYPHVFRDLCPDLIENLGALYARAVAAAGFAERVNLVGWSMGALVAYECARNLVELGLTADSDEAGHLFRHEAGHHSDLKPATRDNCTGRFF